MRFLFVIAIVSGCGSGGGESNPPRCPPPGPLCDDTCGDAVIDDCYRLVNNLQCTYERARDACDGAESTTSCAALGYHGGQPTCSNTCAVDEVSCDPCTSGNTCGGFESPSELTVFSASGDRVLIADDESAVIVNADMHDSGRLALSIGSAAAIPGGWLVYDGSLRRIAESTTTKPWASPAPVLTDGHDSRVLLHWFTNDGVQFALADFSGTVTVPPARLAPTAPARAASDGTSFFVGSNGMLYRIAADGAVTSTTGFPAGHIATVVWGGTSGWYITAEPHRFQRFDATGALVGAPVANVAGPYDAFVSDGDTVVASRTEAAGVTLARIDATGVIGSEVVGLAGEPGTRLARFGSGFVVGWRKNATRVAHVPAF